MYNIKNIMVNSSPYIGLSLHSYLNFYLSSLFLNVLIVLITEGVDNSIDLCMM